MLRKHTVTLLVLCLIAVMLGSCARRARTMPTCSVPQVGACKPCRIACPADQAPKCVAGQGDETTCNVPASCTCS
ncbi:MAG TPA: hypothetical protein VLI89_07150 [Burkholderiales bacterium]|nr:hypothetical protein [Burkholderiales bacterium]